MIRQRERRGENNNMRLVSDNIFHFRRFLKKHKLNLELTLKKLSATQASIHSFPGEEEDRTENIAVEIQPILRPI